LQQGRVVDLQLCASVESGIRSCDALWGPLYSFSAGAGCVGQSLAQYHDLLAGGSSRCSGVLAKLVCLAVRARLGFGDPGQGGGVSGCQPRLGGGSGSQAAAPWTWTCRAPTLTHTMLSAGYAW
jgi:hypothetical protein